MDHKKRADILKHEADSIMGKIFYFRSNRYEDASNKYNAAFNLYKIKKDYRKAIECKKKELECYVKLSDKFNINQAYLEMANIYKYIDELQSFCYYEKVCEYYIENGKFDKLPKVFNDIAELYEKNNNIEKAVEYYKKAGDIYNSNNLKMSTVKCYEKLTDMYLLLSKYENGVETLNDILSLMNDQGTFFSIKYIFKLLVCYMALYSKENLMENYKSKISFILDNYIIFDNSVEHKLLIELTDAFISDNIDKYSKLLQNYDSYKKLDDIYVKLFTDIKNNLMDKNTKYGNYIDLT